jgi:MEDS: MEthanogen/methylotroph, DcmR Sensory domain
LYIVLHSFKTKLMFNNNLNTTSNWKTSNAQMFWSKIAPADHVVQIYEDDKILMNAVLGYVNTGLLEGDSIIIIATQEHIQNLNLLLNKQGYKVDALIARDRYIALEANETLSKFMVNNLPDKKCFDDCISSLFKRAQKNTGKVRAFGEMVAILWEKGLKDATLQLENLWNQLHQKNQFSLFCAYPKNGFIHNEHDCIDDICSTHSKVIVGGSLASSEIYYNTTAATA